jgi:glycosyltransferase involved in cell wall biosynthesis
VIIHGLWQYYDYAAQKAVAAHKKKGLEDIKLYVMPHGMLDPYFQKAPGRKFKAIRNWCYWKLIEHQVVNNADGILFTCEVELRLARETFVPYKPKAEFNVGYGIQAPPAYQKSMIEQFRKTCNLNENEPYLLFLSRIDEKKGVDLLVDAYIKHFRKGFPRLIIAGPSMESPYGQKVNAILHDSNVENDSVIFPGMLLGDLKWGAFYGCEAFILPSHQENFGIAVVEALACGKPVLISDQVNIWHEIIQAKAGFVAADTLAGTLKLMEKWQKLTPEEQKKMGDNGKKAFEQHFTIDRAAHNLFKAVS